MDLQSVLNDIDALPKKEGGEIYITALKPLLKSLKVNHDLAQKLWNSGDRNAREVAVRIAEPEKITVSDLDLWVQEIDEWGLTDSFTGNIVVFHPAHDQKIREWAKQDALYIRRAAFATIAQMAWARNDHEDQKFIGYLALVQEYATDGRDHVRKAVNWALRDIGKRNEYLRKQAWKMSHSLQQSDDKNARWVGRHRMKEIG